MPGEHRDHVIDLSVVIPAFDEAGGIHLMLDEVAGAITGVPGLRWEVVVVDDGSTDATRARVRESMERIPNVRLLTHERRAGKSAALRTAFDAARGRFVATLDGDGQNDPKDLARLWPQVEAGGGRVVFAGRRNRRNDGAVKFLTSRVANFVRRRLLRDDSRDSGCGFKVMPAGFVQEVPYFDNMHRFIPALARRQGFDVREVMVADRPRTHGESKYGFFDRARVALLDVTGVFWLIRRYSPRGEVREVARERAEASVPGARA